MDGAQLGLLSGHASVAWLNVMLVYHKRKIKSIMTCSSE